MEGNFLVTWDLEGETHFLMFPMTEYKVLRSISDSFAGKNLNGLSLDGIDNTVLMTKQKAVKSHTVMLYDNIEWPFTDDNIKKIISIPEFGWK
jgi:hypothetical protein